MNKFYNDQSVYIYLLKCSAHSNDFLCSEQKLLTQNHFVFDSGIMKYLIYTCVFSFVLIQMQHFL